jgi:hypothetical protein
MLNHAGLIPVHVLSLLKFADSFRTGISARAGPACCVRCDFGKFSLAHFFSKKKWGT